MKSNHSYMYKIVTTKTVVLDALLSPAPPSIHI